MRGLICRNAYAPRWGSRKGDCLKPTTRCGTHGSTAKTRPCERVFGLTWCAPACSWRSWSPPRSEGWREYSRLGLARRPVEDLAHGGQQLPDADRLAIVAVETSGHDARSVLGHHRSRDGDDWDGTCRRIGPQPLQGFDAADAG